MSLQAGNQKLQALQRILLALRGARPAAAVVLVLLRAALLHRRSGRRRQQQARCKLRWAALASQLWQRGCCRAAAALLQHGLQSRQHGQQITAGAGVSRDPANTQAGRSAALPHGHRHGSRQQALQRRVLLLAGGRCSRGCHVSARSQEQLQLGGRAQARTEHGQQALGAAAGGAAAAAAAVIVSQLLKLAQVAAAQRALQRARQRRRGRLAAAGLAARVAALARLGGRVHKSQQVNQRGAAAVGLHRLLEGGGQACAPGTRFGSVRA